MALTKEIIVDKIEVLASNYIQIREKILIKEDDTIISSSFHRRVISPNDDVSLEPQKVKDIVAIARGE